MVILLCEALIITFPGILWMVTGAIFLKGYWTFLEMNNYYMGMSLKIVVRVMIEEKCSIEYLLRGFLIALIEQE